MNKEELKELITCEVHPTGQGKIKITATLKIDCSSDIGSDNIEKYPDIVDYIKRRLKEEVACIVYGGQGKQRKELYLAFREYQAAAIPWDLERMTEAEKKIIDILNQK